MPATICKVTIRGTAPYSQSRKVDPRFPRGKDESYEAWEDRVWRERVHTADDGDSITIPAHALHQAMVVGAQKGRLVPQVRNSSRERLAGRLETGVMVLGEATTDMRKSAAQKITILAHSNGDRKAKKATRVERSYPAWDAWTATFEVALVDESLTLDDLREALRWAGLVCGLGRFRPECMGHNGRFVIQSLAALDEGEGLAA